MTAPAAAGLDRPVIRVMVVDDHTVVRQGLIAYFQGVQGIDVVDEAADGQAALDRLARLAAYGELPDVLLLDLQMPRLSGVQTTAAVAARYPDLKVVALTSFGDLTHVHAALAAGAVGYLLKDAEPGDIQAAVRTAVAGQVHLDPVVARRLTQRLVAPSDALAALTHREKDILTLVAQGLSNQEIAARLTISERTARTHVSNLLGKMQVRSRTQAALLAIREGLVPAPGADGSGR